MSFSPFPLPSFFWPWHEHIAIVAIEKMVVRKGDCTYEVNPLLWNSLLSVQLELWLWTIYTLLHGGCYSSFKYKPNWWLVNPLQSAFATEGRSAKNNSRRADRLYLVRHRGRQIWGTNLVEYSCWRWWYYRGGEQSYLVTGKSQLSSSVDQAQKQEIPMEGTVIERERCIFESKPAEASANQTRKFKWGKPVFQQLVSTDQHAWRWNCCCTAFFRPPRLSSSFQLHTCAKKICPTIAAACIAHPWTFSVFFLSSALFTPITRL